MKFNLLLQKIRTDILNPQKPIWIIFTLVLIGVSFLIPQIREQKTPTDIKSELTPSLDTFVPAGFVLVTLQLINNESIDSMIGAYGLVDIYSASHEVETLGAKLTAPIATHLKLIRAPNNPSLYGVLVPENSREIIQQLTGPVFAVIQGPKSKLEIPQKEISKIRKSRSIKYGDLL